MTKLPILIKLEAQFKELERELRVEVPKELQKAAAHGDLKENSEYDAAKNRQTFLQARLGQLSERINTLANLKIEDLPKDSVAFGSKVTLEDLDSGNEIAYEIVAPDEVDPKIGKISLASPIGKALFKKQVGDEVSIQLPSGLKEYELLSLVTIHEIMEAK